VNFLEPGDRDGERMLAGERVSGGGGGGGQRRSSGPRRGGSYGRTRRAR
jgi:hypothetical protein